MKMIDKAKFKLTPEIIKDIKDTKDQELLEVIKLDGQEINVFWPRIKMSIMSKGMVNFIVKGVEMSMSSENFELIQENFEKPKKKLTKNEIILIALTDAADNTDLFFHENEAENTRAQEVLNKEIERISKLLK